MPELSRIVDGLSKAVDQRVRIDIYDRDLREIKEDLTVIRVQFEKSQDAATSTRRQMTVTTFSALLSFVAMLTIYVIGRV